MTKQKQTIDLNPDSSSVAIAIVEKSIQEHASAHVNSWSEHFMQVSDVLKVPPVLQEAYLKNKIQTYKPRLDSLREKCQHAKLSKRQARLKNFYEEKLAMTYTQLYELDI